MPQTQVHASFNQPEIEKLDRKVAELGLSRYLYVRLVVLKDLGVEFNGKPHRKNRESESSRPLQNSERANTKNRELNQDDSGEFLQEDE